MKKIKASLMIWILMFVTVQASLVLGQGDEESGALNVDLSNVGLGNPVILEPKDHNKGLHLINDAKNELVSFPEGFFNGFSVVIDKTNDGLTSISVHKDNRVLERYIVDGKLTFDKNDNGLLSIEGEAKTLKVFDKENKETLKIEDSKLNKLEIDGEGNLKFLNAELNNKNSRIINGGRTFTGVGNVGLEPGSLKNGVKYIGITVSGETRMIDELRNTVANAFASFSEESKLIEVSFKEVGEVYDAFNNVRIRSRGNGGLNYINLNHGDSAYEGPERILELESGNVVNEGKFFDFTDAKGKLIEGNKEWRIYGSSEILVNRPSGESSISGDVGVRAGDISCEGHDDNINCHKLEANNVVTYSGQVSSLQQLWTTATSTITSEYDKQIAELQVKLNNNVKTREIKDKELLGKRDVLDTGLHNEIVRLEVEKDNLEDQLKELFRKRGEALERAGQLEPEFSRARSGAEQALAELNQAETSEDVIRAQQRINDYLNEARNIAQKLKEGTATPQDVQRLNTLQKEAEKEQTFWSKYKGPIIIIGILAAIITTLILISKAKKSPEYKKAGRR